MSNFETAVICTGWAATCVLSWMIGYLTGKAEEGE